MLKYCHRFFRTREEAMRFQRENGGALYVKPVKRTVSRYHDEAYMVGMTQEDMKQLPFCVAWNEQIGEEK